MNTPRIKSTAVLIGYDSTGSCVYSEIIDIHDYYDGEHVWDDSERILQLKLHRVRGYLFNSKGVLDQEFTSIFDNKSGAYLGGHTRYADGTERRDGNLTETDLA